MALSCIQPWLFSQHLLPPSPFIIIHCSMVAEIFLDLCSHSCVPSFIFACTHTSLHLIAHTHTTRYAIFLSLFPASLCFAGLQRDLNDKRSRSFVRLMWEVLPAMQHPPQYILLENVKEFELSQSCMLLLESLKQCRYSVQQFLLSPVQFGIPNQRWRYFMLVSWFPLFPGGMLWVWFSIVVPCHECMFPRRPICNPVRFLHGTRCLHLFFIPLRVVFNSPSRWQCVGFFGSE